ncbi:unnamed protein product [Heterobilharzia americana]|nr:unnamed protein product [Heterobilharzia americana]
MVHFWGTSSSLLSVWLTVTLTAERALVVSFPLHVTRIISYSRVRNIIVIMSIICTLLSLHFLFTVGTISDCSLEHPQILSSSWASESRLRHINKTHPFHVLNSQNRCLNNCAFLPKYLSLNWYWSTFDAILYSYLPFCLIFAFNVIILRSVYRASKERNILRGPKSRQSFSRRPDSSPTGSVIASTSFSMRKYVKTNDTNYNVRQLTVVLLVISFSFLLTTVSIVLIKILAQLLDFRGRSKINSRIYFRLADTIAELFMYINHAMNFYLFCATGRTFRRRLVLLFSQPRRGKLKSIDSCCFTCSCSYCLPMLNLRPSGNRNIYSRNKLQQTKSLNPVYKPHQNCPTFLLSPQIQTCTIHLS